jgi:hypothetical protein
MHRIVAIRRRFVRRRLLLHLRRIGVLLHCNCAGNALAMRWMRWKFLLVLRHIWVLVLRRRFNTPHVICKCRIATPTSYSPASSPTSARTANCSPSSDAAMVAMQIAIEELQCKLPLKNESISNESMSLVAQCFMTQQKYKPLQQLTSPRNVPPTHCQCPSPCYIQL